MPLIPHANRPILPASTPENSPKNIIAKKHYLIKIVPMITNLSVTRALAQGKLIVSVDAGRLANDPFKLPAALLALLTADIATLENEDAATHSAEGVRSVASANVRSALEKLESALRAGYAGIEAILGDDIVPTGISAAARTATFTTYGWEKDLLGRFNDSRVLMLAELALQAETTVANPAWRYAPAIVTAIRTQLEIIEDAEPGATSGDRQVSVEERSHARESLQTRISRARYFYCSASDELDSTKELAKISFQPRRPASSASAPSAPTPPAPAP